MKFSDFKSVEEVLAKYPLIRKNEQFLPNITQTPPDWFIDELEFVMKTKNDVESEMFYREAFVFPFMQRAWKPYPKLKLWVNRKLAYKDELMGEPDYFVSALPQGPTRDPVGKPLVAIAEAKQEDFIAGWGQCLAEMIACQKLNGDEATVIYGIVSTGLIWEFGKLEKETFTRNITAYTVYDPAKLLGVLDYVFEQCERQVTGGSHEIQRF